MTEPIEITLEQVQTSDLPQCIVNLYTWAYGNRPTTDVELLRFLELPEIRKTYEDCSATLAGILRLFEVFGITGFLEAAQRYNNKPTTRQFIRGEMDMLYIRNGSTGEYCEVVYATGDDTLTAAHLEFDGSGRFTGVYNYNDGGNSCGHLLTLDYGDDDEATIVYWEFLDLEQNRLGDTCAHTHESIAAVADEVRATLAAMPEAVSIEWADTERNILKTLTYRNKPREYKDVWEFDENNRVKDYTRTSLVQADIRRILSDRAIQDMQAEVGLMPSFVSKPADRIAEQVDDTDAPDIIWK